MSVLNISPEALLRVQIEDAREEAFKKGMFEEKIKIATNLLKLNLTIAEIAKATDIPPEEITKLATEHKM
ncbi:MAG: hypothetical protein FWG68_09975 [Defluviitaleaceae bacterium]|nr:hypothetical protein [Defluviitaleaceae bacterium]